MNKRYFWGITAATVLLTPQMRAIETSIAQSAVSDVIVFNNQARVTRTTTLTVKPGEHSIDIEGIPERLIDSSLRVDIAHQDIQLLSVEIPRKYGAELNPAKLESVIKERDKLLDIRKALDRRRQQLLAKKEIARALKIGSKPSESEPPAPDLFKERWESVLSFTRQHIEQCDKELREIGAQKRDLNITYNTINSEYYKLRSYHRESRKVARIKVRATKSTTTDIKVTYQISGASWNPAYDAHIDVKTGDISLSYYALISQNTGEDWSNIPVVCSTAVPSRSADLPKLMTNVYREQEQKIMNSYSKSAPSSKFSYRSSAPKRKRKLSLKKALPQISELAIGADAEEDMIQSSPQRYEQQQALTNSVWKNNVNTIIRKDGTSIKGKVLEANAREFVILDEKNNEQRFNLDSVLSLSNTLIHQSDDYNTSFFCPPYKSAGGFDYRFPAARTETIASDGKRHRLLLKTSLFKGKKQYFVIPFYNDHAYLKTFATNSDSYPILQGPVNVFFGDDFIGDSQLNTIPANTRFELSLGVDERITVKQRNTKEARTTGLLSNTRTTDVLSELSLTNNTGEAINVMTIGRIPVSMRKSVEVNSYRESEKSLNDRKNELIPKGIKRWITDIKSGTTKEIKYSYTVEHPVSDVLKHRDGTVTPFGAGLGLKDSK